MILAVGARRISMGLLLAGLPLVFSAPLYGQTISQLLKQSAQAAETVSYQGTFVYSQGRETETMRIFHRRESGGFRERIFSLNGDQSEIVRNGKGVWCYFPQRKEGFFKFRDEETYRMPKMGFVSIPELIKYYSITLDRRERIANRWTKRLNFRPKDSFRYGLSLWIDEETGLMLRSDLYDQNSEVIDRYMFVDIAMNADIPDANLMPSVAGVDYVWNFSTGSQLLSAYESTPLTVKMIPDGFKKVRHYRSHHVDGIKEQLVFSDELATVSVFMQTLQSDDVEGLFAGASRLGSVNAYGRVIDGYQITVLGEVPVKTVRAIADSVEVGE